MPNKLALGITLGIALTRDDARAGTDHADDLSEDGLNERAGS